MGASNDKAKSLNKKLLTTKEVLPKQLNLFDNLTEGYFSRTRGKTTITKKGKDAYEM